VVDDEVGNCVGDFEKKLEGKFVGKEFTLDGLCVEVVEGALVRGSDGALVGVAVGTVVGIFVGALVGPTVGVPS